VTTATSIVSVDVLDAAGNPVATSTVDLGGTAHVAAINGVATFDSSLGLKLSGLVGTYKLRFSMVLPTAHEVIQTIELAAGDPFKLSMITQPQGAKNGELLSTQPAVQIRDFWSNPVLDATNVVTASVSGGSTADGTDASLINADHTQTAANGVARFTALQLKGMPGWAYNLHFTAAGLVATDSAQVSVTPGDAAALAVITQPGSASQTKTVNGQTLSSPAVVELRDQYGYKVSNDSSTYVTAVLHASEDASDGPGHGSISGVYREKVVNGVATFDGVVLTGLTSEHYWLTFTVAQIVSPASQQIPLQAAAPSALALTDASGARAGANFTTAPVLKMTDFSGNPIDNRTAYITVDAVDSTTLAKASVIGSQAVTTTTSGIATLNNLGLSAKIGTYTLTYSVGFEATANDPAVNLSATQSIQLSSGVADHLTVTKQPSSGGATGDRFTDTPIVSVMDEAGNLVADSDASGMTVTLRGLVTSGFSGEQRISTGTDAVTAANGVAQFNNLAVIGQPGHSYTLQFSLNGMHVTSAAFSLTHAAPAQLVMQQAPVGGMKSGTVFTTAPIVKIIDAYSNDVNDDNSDHITAAITAGANGELIGSSSVQVVNGVADYSALKLAGKVTEAYTLSFALDGTSLAPVTAAGLTVIPGSPYRLSMATQPVGARTGEVLATQPEVKVFDQWGNFVNSHPQLSIVATISPNSGPDAGVITGSTTITTDAGDAAFTDLAVTAIPGVDYVMQFATSGGTNLIGATSAVFHVAAGAPHHIGLTQQPLGGVTGKALVAQPELAIYDFFGNVVDQQLNLCANVTISTSSASGGSFTSSADTLDVCGTTGHLAFSGLKFKGLPDQNYKLHFSVHVPNQTYNGVSTDAFDLTADSGNFQVRNDVSDHIAIETQPAGARAGELFATQPVIRILDKYGNLAKDDNSTVVTAAAIGSSATATGQVTATAIGGLVTFTGSKIEATPGTGYLLHFSTTGLGALNSDQFDVTAGAPHHLSVDRASVWGLTGEVFTGQPVISVRDQFNNIVLSDNGRSVSAAISAGAGGVIEGNYATTVNGVARFSGLKITGAPGEPYTLNYTANAVTAIAESNIVLTKVTALTLSYPATTYSFHGQAVATSTVELGGGTPTFTTGSAACSVDATDGTVHIVTAGDCAVTMSVPLNGSYLANSITTVVGIAKATQPTLSITSSNAATYGVKKILASGQANVNGDLPANPVVWSTTGTCKVVSNTLFVGDAGSDCVVQASRAGDINYLSAVSTPMTIDVAKADQRPLVISSADAIKVGDSVTLAATGGNGTGAVTFSRADAGTACDFNAQTGLVTAHDAGTCSFNAVKAGDNNYNDGLQSGTSVITVSKLAQNLSFTSVVPMYPIPSNASADATYDPQASGNSGGPVTYSLASSSTSGLNPICSITGGTVKFLNLGHCVVIAAQAGTNMFAAATARQDILVGALNQTITMDQPAETRVGSAAFVQTATSNSGLAVEITSATTDVCTVTTDATDQTMVYPVGAGNCELHANQAGNATYTAATEVIRSFAVRADLPGAPMITSISSFNQAVTVSFTAPSYNGGTPITAYSYTATGTDGSTVSGSGNLADINGPCNTIAGTTSCTLYGLTNGISYTISVSAVNIEGTGNPSPASPSFIPGPALMGVQELKAVPNSAGGIDLLWLKPEALEGNFTSYDIFSKVKGTAFTSTPDQVVTDENATQTTLSASVLPVAPASVRPASVGGSSSSNTSTASMRFGRASLRAAAVTGGSGSSGSGSGSGSSSGSGSADTTTSPTGYEFKVVTMTTLATVEATGNTTTAVQTPNMAPGAPTQLAATISGSSLLISWGASTFDGGATISDYRVAVNGTPLCVTLAASRCTLGGLQLGTTYTVSVAAKNSVGVGVAATTTVQTAPRPVAPPAPVTPVVPPVPTASPTPTPTVSPTPGPTVKPTPRPTPKPTNTPAPSAAPTTSPSPSASPSETTPTSAPIAGPTTDPGSPTDTPVITPGAPEANPAIGATGDDSAPSVPFDPMGSPESIKAVTKTVGKVAAIAAAMAAAAAAAAAGAAAAGAVGAAGAAGGASSGSGGGSDGSIATIDAEHEEFELRRRGRGDRLKIWRRRWMRLLDGISVKATLVTAPVSPVISKIMVDGSYLRAAFGIFAALPTIVATLVSIFAIAINGTSVSTPIWQLFLAIALIGIFDAFAGMVGTAVFVIGTLVLHIANHGSIGLDDIRMMLGVIIVGFGPALLANSFRAFRKVPEKGTSYIWERIIDLGVLPFIGGWVTSSMISTLPALAGVTLAVANHVTDFSLAVAIAIVLRVVLEEAIARGFAGRLDMLHPTHVPHTHSFQRWVSVSFRLSVFIFVTAALMGNHWQVWVGSALFVLPTVIGWWHDKFPNFTWIWRVMPQGIPGLALTLLVASLTTNLVSGWFGSTPDLALWSFALLPIPMLALHILGIIGREGNPGEHRWIRQQRLVWIYRIGGIVMFILTLKVAGVI